MIKTLFRISALLLVFAFLGLFNAGLIELRLKEIGYLLGNFASQEKVSNTLGIVAKYELVKQRMLSGEENVTNYELEAKIQALTSGDKFDTKEQGDLNRYYLQPVKVVVNGIRWLMGKPIINPTDDDKIFRVLEIGYFWERNRKYAEAIDIYNDVLEKPDLDANVHAAVLVHKAFCHSMISEYDKSRLEYEQVIRLYPNSEAGILSWKLLDFIESIERERTRVESKKTSDLEKAKQYYMLMDYRNTIKFVSKFLESKPAKRLAVEADFYKGRAHEEIGEVQEAIVEYNNVIQNDTDGRWARQANRRLIMLGDFYETRKQVSAEARKRLEQYQDALFANKVEQYSTMVTKSSLREELLMSAGKQSRQSTVASDTVMDILNKIGTFDLTGEEALKQRQEEEQALQERIKVQNLSQPERRELIRQSIVSQHPYRSASAIKAVIAEHTSELQYLYNRTLRRGSRLSGKMVVTIKIQSNGTVEAVVDKSNIGNSEFEAGVVESVKRWKFRPVPDSLGTYTVNYPFEFYRED